MTERIINCGLCCLSHKIVKVARMFKEGRGQSYTIPFVIYDSTTTKVLTGMHCLLLPQDNFGLGSFFVKGGRHLPYLDKIIL